MRITIEVDATDPLHGAARAASEGPAGPPHVEFVGWLGLLAALRELLGEDQVWTNGP